jgi:phage head maturation protease
MANRPEAGKVETRHTEITADGRKIRGVVPYGVESRDMGGWREVVDRGALDQTNLDELIAARIDHTGVPIGRFPKTLDLESRADGLHWAVTPPGSRADLLEAIERGDLRAGSSPISLSRFEENAGATNTSTVRLEGHAAFGTERTTAAARVMP